MDYRVLDITVISAEGLKNVNTFSDMEVYVAGLISGDRRTEGSTLTDRRGGSNPEWNHRMKFSVADADVANPTDHFVQFQLRSRRRILGDRDIGFVSIRLHELLKTAADAAGESVVEHKVRDRTGKTTDAVLKFSYRFDEKFVAPRPEKFYDSGMWFAPPPLGVAPPHRSAQLYHFPAETVAIEYGCAQMKKKNKHFLCFALFG